MDWELAIEKNHGALRRIMAMLVALVGMTGGAADNGTPQATLPRHLHRFVLRLLRPAEAATRRLIIIAAQGLVVKLPKFRESKPSPKKPPLNRKSGYGTGLVIRPGPLPEWARALVPKRSPSLSLPLLDPMKRFGVRRRYAKRSAMPQIRVLGGDPIIPLFRRPEPLPPPAPTPDDPLDAASIHRRLEVLGRALDDLPKQAMRMARWQARRDARAEREREVQGQDNIMPVDRPPLRFASQTTSPPFDGGEEARRQGEAPFLYPREAGGEVARAKPETEWGAEEPGGRWASLAELGVTPEAIALLDRSRRKDGPAQSSTIAAASPKPRRFHRMSPMRPGRPPGWRRKPNHDVYEVLNELHGLAVWARERRDSS